MTGERLIAIVMLLVLVLVGVVVGLASIGEAQGSACKPVMLCPYVAGGSGGRGGAGGEPPTAGGGAGHPGGGLDVSALVLDRRIVRPGQALAGEVTYTNESSAPMTLREVRIAARAPGATHEGGPFTDLEPVLQNVTLPAGGHVTLAAARTFSGSDTPGQWELYPAHQDAAGVWHDGRSKYVRFVAADGGGGSGGGAAPGPMRVGTQEWYIAPWAGTHVYRDGIDWASAYSSGTDIWAPQFISELSGYEAFRHMDTNATNHSRISSWSQRKLPSDPRNAEVYIDGSSDADTTGLAIEWQIDLCNRAHVDCWFTHPYLADDSYLREQAKLVKAKLNPNARVYIELSNEVWNGAFRAHQQSIDAGIALGLPGSNQWYVGIAHELFRALAMYAVYADVFGADAMGSRVIRVFSESGNLDLTTQALANVYDSPEWNPSGQRIDMFALAPYVGNGVDGASETLERWQGEVDDKLNDPIAYVLERHAQAYDVPLLGCYEAGMHHLSNADAWARHDDAYDAYVYMLDRFATKLNAPCMLYTLHGTWEGKGAWGAYDHVGQALDAAPKARAAREWIAGTATRESKPNLLAFAAVALVTAVLALVLLYLRRRWGRK